MSNFSRRKLITTGIAATTGAAGLAVAARLADQYGLLPPDCRGIYGTGNTLTYASQRLLTRHSMAREFPPSQISTAPFAKIRPFKNETYEMMRAGNFKNWRVEVDGMVSKPSSFSLADLKSFPARTQITQLICEEGWNFIAEWVGVPLSHILNLVGALPQAAFVHYYSIQRNWRQSIDMVDALHPQTLLTYGMNGDDISMGHGAPVRLCIPRQLGYKSVKFITRLTITDRLDRFNPSYSWYAGI
jgi:DMSO/TMAO reductase YedYZ molybdopterin-dependent catalytic subunit